LIFFLILPVFGCAGCLAAGRFGERNPDLIDLDKDDSGKGHSDSDNMKWNIIGTRLLIENSDWNIPDILNQDFEFLTDHRVLVDSFMEGTVRINPVKKWAIFKYIFSNIALLENLRENRDPVKSAYRMRDNIDKSYIEPLLDVMKIYTGNDILSA